MKGWLIYNRQAAKENASYIAWFKKEANLQQINLQVIYRESLTIGIEKGNHILFVNGRKAKIPDFAIVRIIEPTLQFYLEACNVATFNSSHVSHICNHKALTHLEVNKLNIPMVPTYFFSVDNLPEVLPLHYPFIMKEATGRSGKQVYFINNEQEWNRALTSITTKDFLIQSADVMLGKDLRVFVIGKEIISAVLRINQDDFRANYSLGGKALLYHLSETEIKMIQKIVNHFDFGFVGIDFLIGKNNELLFNEIEDVVGSRILSEVSEINLLEKYITQIKKTLVKVQV